MAANIFITGESSVLVDLADQVVRERAVGGDPASLLGEVLARGGSPEALTPRSSRRPLTAAEIFYAFAYSEAFPGRSQEAVRSHLERSLELAAAPLTRAESLRPGDVLVRSAEGGLAHLALLVTGETFAQGELEGPGIRPESARPGCYAVVIEAGAKPHVSADCFARRVSDGSGRLGYDTLILRIRPEAYAALPAVPVREGSRGDDDNPLAIEELDEALDETLAEAAGSGPEAPPRQVRGWQLGVDLYALNTTNAAGFVNLRSRGKVFAIAKTSQGLVSDGKFSDYYRWIKEAGMIRGSYHFLANKWDGAPSAFAHGSMEEQAKRIISPVGRLGPGDLAPAIDIEDEPRLPNGKKAPKGAGRFPLDQGIVEGQQGYHYRNTRYANWQDGRDALLADIQDLMDRVETALGRTPIIYTSIAWKDSDMMNNPTVMAQYPLWTVYHGEHNKDGTPNMSLIRVGSWGNKWDFIQYAEDGGNWWGLDPYHEPGINIDGIDFDAYTGTIYGMRGLADIGRPGVALTPGVPELGLKSLPCIAHGESDGSQHLISGPAWMDVNLWGVDVPVGGDPVLLTAADALYMYFRSGPEIVEATATRARNWRWAWSKLAIPSPAIHDPSAVLAGGRPHVVYWGDDDDWHLLTMQGGWVDRGSLLARAGIKTAKGGRAAGQPTAYVAGGTVHVAGRVNLDDRVEKQGHLYDLWEDRGTWRGDDLTAAARRSAPDLRAATYSPCAYETSAGAAIVFREVRGDLWVINRADNRPVNVTAAARAVKAAGHPSCFVLNDRPHIVFRGADKLVYDLAFDGSAWRAGQICTPETAADPRATSDGRTGLAAVRTASGLIYAAQFDGANWACAPTTQGTMLRS